MKDRNTGQIERERRGVASDRISKWEGKRRRVAVKRKQRGGFSSPASLVHFFSPSESMCC